MPHCIFSLVKKSQPPNCHGIFCKRKWIRFKNDLIILIPALQVFGATANIVYPGLLPLLGNSIVGIKTFAGITNALLLKIRFDNAVQIKLGIDELAMQCYLIPPISLQQVLAENAIKHNEFSETQPLVFTIQLQNDELWVSNPARKKALRKPFSKIGLQNLQERYKLTTRKEIVMQVEENLITVILPVLKIL